jgi:hypothetical protein
MRATTSLGLVFIFAGLMIAGCEREPEDPSGYGQPTGYDQYGNPIYAQPTGGYAQPTGGYGQPYPQPGYPQPGQPGYPQPGYPQPTATAAQPSPLALPCQNDFTCGTHKCNLQAGRCAFPCANAATDCAAGMGCMAGLCVPGAPAQ